MREDSFPGIWVPSPENRDLRQIALAPASAGTECARGS
jgi:hypothetical protein